MSEKPINSEEHNLILCPLSFMRSKNLFWNEIREKFKLYLIIKIYSL